MDAVRVELGPRSYNIVFNDLDSIATAVLKVVDSKSIFLVSNSVVGPLYAKKVEDSFNLEGVDVHYIQIKDGESEKTPETYFKLVSELLEKQVQRSSVLIALGGGVTTDIAGFAAATVLRGISFVTVPTTLLAMVDASVGGKTGVNTKFGKNLLGSFWQPKLVYVPMECLKTLSDAEFRCGMGEIIKHSVLDHELCFELDEKKVSHLDWLLHHGAKIASRSEDSQELLKKAIKRSCQYKALIVALDEREGGRRALLNFGHTVAHAIEYVQGIHAKDESKLRHGEAVAIGCLVETELALYRGVLEDVDLLFKLKTCMTRCGLPTGIKGLNIDELIKACMMDKKREEDYIKVTQPIQQGKVILEKIKPVNLRYAFEQLEKN